MSVNKCARCDQTVYPVEGLRCLDKMWHKGCFKCQECSMTLSLKNYKGFEKKPYCNAHCPQAKATTVADTPEIRRLAETTRIQSQAKYHEDFEKSKGKGYTAVADDVELQRIKNTTKIISNVAYHGELERKKQMEEKRTSQTIEDVSPHNHNHHHQLSNSSHSPPNNNSQPQPQTQPNQFVKNSANAKQIEHHKVSPTHQQRQAQPQQQPIKQQTPVHYHAQEHNQMQSNGHQSAAINSQQNRQVPQNQVDGMMQQQQKQMVKINSQHIHPQQQILLLQQQQQQLLMQQQQMQHKTSMSLDQQQLHLKQQSINNNNNRMITNNNNNHLTKQQMQLQMQMQMNMQNHQYPTKYMNPNEALPMMANQQHHHVMGVAQAPAMNAQRIAAQNQTMMPAIHPAMLQGYNQQQMAAHLSGMQKMPNKQMPGGQQYNNGNNHNNRGAQVKPGNQHQQAIMHQHPGQRLSGHLQPMPLGPMGHPNQMQSAQHQHHAAHPMPRRMFRAMYDYIANDVDEVSFYENDILVDCVNVDNNWLIGKVARSGQTGMLPANYVTEYAGH